MSKDEELIIFKNVVYFQHIFWKKVLKRANIVVDATCGNGHDTVYLAEHVRKGSTIYALDLQSVALQNTKEKIEALKQAEEKKGIFQSFNIFYEQADHAHLENASLPEKIDLVVFNLGYLPKGNHTIHTKGDSTIQGISFFLERLHHQGVITLVAYPGTDVGREEMLAVESFLSTLDQKSYYVYRWTPINQINNPPQLFVIQGR